MDPSNNNETISIRLARYLDRIKHSETKNAQTFLQQADTRLVQQAELHSKDLKDLRDQYEIQLQSNREQMTNLFKAKLKAVETASQHDKEALEHVLKTLGLMHNQINESESRVLALEQTKFTLNDGVRDLQTGLEIERSQANTLQEEENRLREELALKIKEHEGLVDPEAEKSLRLEIAKFNDLLSREEKRMKLSASSTSSLSQQTI